MKLRCTWQCWRRHPDLLHASRDLGLKPIFTGLSGVIRVFNTGCSSCPRYSNSKLTMIYNSRLDLSWPTANPLRCSCGHTFRVAYIQQWTGIRVAECVQHAKDRSAWIEPWCPWPPILSHEDGPRQGKAHQFHIHTYRIRITRSL